MTQLLDYCSKFKLKSKRVIALKCLHSLIYSLRSSGSLLSSQSEQLLTQIGWGKLEDILCCKSTMITVIFIHSFN